MINKKKCLIGNSRDDGSGIIFILIILFAIIYIISLIINIIIYIGAAIGGGYAVRNYYLAFKHNVIDNKSESSTNTD